MLELLRMKPATIGQLFDIGLAVVRERASQFLLLAMLVAAWGGGALLAKLATLLATALHERFSTLPQFQPSFSTGFWGTMEHAPQITWLGILPPLVMFAVLARAGSTGIPAFQWPFVSTTWKKLSLGEVFVWCVVLLATSIVDQLCRLTDTGYPHSVGDIWETSKLMTQVSLLFLIQASSRYAEYSERIRAMTSGRPSPPQAILG
jgi:hypothetical protein